MSLTTLTPAHIQPLVSALEGFIGQDRVRAAVESWRRAVNGSHGLARIYHEQQSYFWWRAFDEFWQATDGHAGRIVAVSEEVIALAKDAKKVVDLLPGMPASVQKSYVGALGSLENAPSHMYELSMAHHFLTSGYGITWSEQAEGRMPEFTVTTPSFAFETECKQISIDKGRRIARLDFYKLADQVDAEIRARHLMGEISIDLSEPLPSNPHELKRLAADIGNLVTGSSTGMHDLPGWGSIALNLTLEECAPIDFPAAFRSLREHTPWNAHSVLIAKDHDGQPARPLTIMASCGRADKVLESVYGTLKDGARQLSGKIPGVLFAYIPEIEDFASLAQGTGLEAMARRFFASNTRTHVAAVSFSSQTKVIHDAAGAIFTAQALAYSNPMCRFEVSKGFRYFPPELPADSSALK